MIIQEGWSNSTLQTLSLEDAFYRTTLYEENYILPVHYILTRGSVSEIPLPIPEVPNHLKRGSVEYTKYVVNAMNEAKRKSIVIRDRYRSVKPKEVAFQISLKVPLAFIAPTRTQFYFGYTSRSWWQCYTGISAFFREIEQKADFFIEQPFSLINARHIKPNLHFEKIKVGMLHHSNGEGWEFEHSWNRLYVALFLKWFTHDGQWRLVLTRWYILNTPDKKNYNADIEDFLGTSEMRLDFEGKVFQWTMRVQKHALQYSLSVPLSRSLRGMVYYFSGYGSTIGLYNTFCHSIGIGFQAKY
jgi:outer membrane phospholipase A